MFNDDAIGGFLVGMCFGAVAVLCSVLFTVNYFETQAIKHGAARYNPVTSNFEWNQSTAEKTDSK